jgi:acyl-CoA hydrolase
MVAVDESGEPIEVPRLVPETADEERREREAETRRRNRLAERDEILEGRRAGEGARG